MQQRSFSRSILLPEEGWLSFVFLCAVALSSVRSVQAAAWVDNLDILPWLTLLGVLCGFILAKIRLPAILVHPLGLGIGLALVLYAVAGTLPGHSLRANLLTLWDRLERWVDVTATGGISTDNLLFLLLLAAIVWLMGYYGAWSVFRARGPWWVILTSGSVLVVNLSYARSLDVFALFYLLSAMLLVVRLNVAVQEENWRRSGVEYSSDFGWQLVRSSVVVAAVVVLATWLAPSSSASQHLAEAWTRVNGPWQNTEAQFSRLFGGLRAKDQGNASGFGKTLALRGATTLGDTVVLALTATQPRYLRGIVYDRYTGQGWLAPELGSDQMLPNDPRLTATGTLLLREEVTTTIKVLQPRGMTVMAPAQPLRISLPSAAEYESAGNLGESGAAENTPVDVSVLHSALMLRRGQQYVAISSVSRADIKSLRAAGTEYPPWVKQRYLAWPRTVPGRVLSLARRITAGMDNPYDKATAIQSFLRTYPYSEVVPPPPVGRDAIDYFLFEARLGYCDYYASAMVIMLRSLGVPARLVSGYSPGEYDPTQQAYLVRDANAHSWPEVYFPRHGWVEFEPTASRPGPIRPAETSVEQPTSTPDQTGMLDDLDPSLITPDEKERLRTLADDMPSGENAFVSVGKLVASVLLLAILAYLVLLLLWRRALHGLMPSEAAYAKMTWLARWVGAGRLPHQTPHEHGRWLATLVPEEPSDVQFIVERFVRERFGRKPPSQGDATRLADAWQRLRWRLVSLAWRRPRAP